jgi:hypothetical protein
MSDVWVIVEAVQYEGKIVRDVCATREAAHDRVAELAENHRYTGEWNESQDDGGYALTRGDVTMMASRWTVTE